MAVSNANYANPGGMLSVWMENVKRAGVKNAMVVALDDATKGVAEAAGIPGFRMDLKVGYSTLLIFFRLICLKVLQIL